MITVEELQPLDFIVSYKKPTNLPERIGNAGILSYGKRIYPHGIRKVNHIRIVEGFSGKEQVGFEWTHPRSQEFPIREWMLTPGYSWVLRFPIITSYEKVHQEVLKHCNKRYDYLQLFGIYFGLKWLQFGEKYEVCSTGAREIFEDITDINLFYEIERWRTPPCSWTNHTEKFLWLNEPTGAAISPLLKKTLESKKSITS